MSHAARSLARMSVLLLGLAGCGGSGGGSGGGDGPDLVAMIGSGSALGYGVTYLSSANGESPLDGATSVDTQFVDYPGVAGAIFRETPYVFSHDGTWVLVKEEDATGRVDLVAIQGSTRRTLTSMLAETDAVKSLAGGWSPTATAIAFTWRQPTEALPRLWIADPQAQSLESPFPLASSPLEFGWEVWSRTRTALALSWRPGFTGGWRAGVVEAGTVVELLPPGIATDVCVAYWNDAGDRIAWLVPTSTGATQIYVTDVPPLGTAPTIPSAPLATLAADVSFERFSWSPDGTRLAWLSDEGMPSKVWQLVTIPANGGSKTVIGPDGLFSNVLDQSYVWTTDSSRVLYQRESSFGGESVVSVAVSTGAEVIAATVPAGRESRSGLAASAGGAHVAFLDAIVSGNDESDFRLRLIGPGGVTSFDVGPSSTIGAQFAWAPVGDRLAVTAATFVPTPSRFRAIFTSSGPSTPFLESVDSVRGEWSGDGRWYVVPNLTQILGLREGDAAFTTLASLPVGPETYFRVAVR